MFVVYHKETTLRAYNPQGHGGSVYKTESAAKAYLTRLVKRFSNIKREDYAIAELGVFYNSIEKSEVVINLMSGKPVTQSVNTPLCCDVSSELYWTM